jgi:hypothetical protein
MADYDKKPSNQRGYTSDDREQRESTTKINVLTMPPNPTAAAQSIDIENRDWSTYQK